MQYQAIELELSPEALSRVGDQWLRCWRETMVDAQDTVSQALTSTSPMDALSLQVAFGLRTTQRWFGLADWTPANGAATPAGEEAAENSAAPPTAPERVPAPDSPSDSPSGSAPVSVAANEAAAPTPHPVEPASDEASPAPALAALAAEPEPEPEPEPQDDLQRIRGIGPAIARKLEAHGIDSFAAMAALDPAAVEALDAALDLKGRIERDDWIAQAQALLEQP